MSAEETGEFCVDFWPGLCMAGLVVDQKVVRITERIDSVAGTLLADRFRWLLIGAHGPEAKIANDDDRRPGG